jgi:hypothetical protein
MENMNEASNGGNLEKVNECFLNEVDSGYGILSETEVKEYDQNGMGNGMGKTEVKEYDQNGFNGMMNNQNNGMMNNQSNGMMNNQNHQSPQQQQPTTTTVHDPRMDPQLSRLSSYELSDPNNRININDLNVVNNMNYQNVQNTQHPPPMQITRSNSIDMQRGLDPNYRLVPTHHMMHDPRMPPPDHIPHGNLVQLPPGTMIHHSLPPGTIPLSRSHSLDMGRIHLHEMNRMNHPEMIPLPRSQSIEMTRMDPPLMRTNSMEIQMMNRPPQPMENYDMGYIRSRAVSCDLSEMRMRARSQSLDISEYGNNIPVRENSTMPIIKTIQKKKWRKMNMELFYKILEYEKENPDVKQSDLEQIFNVNRSTYWRWKKKHSII